MKRFGSPQILLFFITLLFSSAAFAQAVPWFDDAPLPADQPPEAVSADATPYRATGCGDNRTY